MTVPERSEPEADAQREAVVFSIRVRASVDARDLSAFQLICLASEADDAASPRAPIANTSIAMRISTSVRPSRRVTFIHAQYCRGFQARHRLRLSAIKAMQTKKAASRPPRHSPWPGGQSRRQARRRECPPIRNRNQVQTIWPPADDEQVLVVSECVAAACQEAGGPATAVAVTVTFADGRKP